MFDEKFQRKTAHDDESHDEERKLANLKTLKRNNTFVPAQFETEQQPIQTKNFNAVRRYEQLRLFLY